ncbi:hypothetical protein RYH80_07005 [Halobaculum sp. MBLA0147]|uniref:capsular polysaccharide export protein, LipB/KpsS family n=1 Tax=Halobaculum sp. MBLA0147 TaxID=3079934 RepID=UPI0035239AF7
MAVDSLVKEIKDILGPVLQSKATERYLSEVYYGLRPLDPSIRREIERIDFPEIDNSQTEHVALFPDFAPENHRTVFKAVLAHALYQNGIGSIFLFGDKALPICGKKNSEADCVECVKKSDKLADVFGIQHHGVGELAESGSEVPEEVSDRLSRYAEGSVKGKLRIAETDEDDPYHRRLLEQYQRAGEIAWQAAQGANRRFGYDYAVINMGPGLPARGSFEYLDAHDKNILGVADPVFGWGNGFLFNKGDRPLVSYMSEEGWEEVEARDLDDDQLEELDSFMAERFESATYQQYARRGTDIATQLGLDTREHNVYVLFTHILWDAAVAKRVSRVFEDHNEWVFETIDAFEDRDDQLIVKTHPAEKVRGTNQGVGSLIDARYDSLPSSVTVLPPETEINTYDLIDFTDVTLAMTSTAGLESAYKGNPVIAVGDAHYTGKGFTHDASTREEYFDLLTTDPATLDLSEAARLRALKYTYNFFIDRPVHFESLHPQGLTEAEEDRFLTIESYDEIRDDTQLQNLAESFKSYDNKLYYGMREE